MLFQGHYLAKQIEIHSSGKEFADLSIATIDSLNEEPDAMVSPPTDAKPVDLGQIEVKFETGSRWPPAYRKIPPVYPWDAKQSRAQGTVDLEVTIGEDGYLRDVRVVGGPPLLQKAARDAVIQWIYKPFMVMGEPRPVKTTLHIIFSIG